MFLEPEGEIANVIQMVAPTGFVRTYIIQVRDFIAR